MTVEPEDDLSRERAAHALKQFLSEGKYLPEVMRDFHDAKEIFKTMHHLSGWNEKEGWARGISWMDGQIYVIDLFLHFMARHGYTLQRSRAKLEFHDLDDKRRRFRDEQGDALANFLAARIATPPGGSADGESMTEDEEVGVEAESAATPVEEEAGEPQSEPAEDGRKGGASVFLLDSFRKMD